MRGWSGNRRRGTPRGVRGRSSGVAEVGAGPDGERWGGVEVVLRLAGEGRVRFGEDKMYSGGCGSFAGEEEGEEEGVARGLSAESRWSDRQSASSSMSAVVVTR